MNYEFKIDINISANSREEYREKLIMLFLKEKHGTLDDVNYYYYTVERLSDGNVIYLKRPTSLNKGVDFEVRVSNVQFRFGKYGNEISTGNRPSHSDIFDDLRVKKAESEEEYNNLFKLITKIYKCENVSPNEMNMLNFSKGISVEIILYVLKWLFIEQDITYWNRSGREMLYNGICDLWEE